MPTGSTTDTSGDWPEGGLEETLRQAASGNQRAWQFLVEAYSSRVFGLLRAQCNDADLAEELTQSTFCTIVSKLNSYTEVGRFESWLFRIAMNRLRDEMRRRRRQASPMESDSLAGMAGAAPADPSATQPEPAEVADLEQALGQLSEKDRQVILLRHRAELSFKQIAELLDEPIGTVLARHHRSLKKLRDILSRSSAPDATVESDD